MTTKTYRSYSTLRTPQSEPLPGSNQIANDAGGFGFPVDDWVRLNRFLILGSEAGTYYVKEQALTKQNAQAVQRCLQADGPRVVSEIVAISQSGRAPKNDPALFALAMAIGLGDLQTRQLAASALPQVARYGTAILNFVAYATQFRGWGRALRRAVANWYTSQDIDHLSYELLKYQSRDKWAQRDLLRLAHPKAGISDVSAVLRYAVHGTAAAHAKEGDLAHRSYVQLTDGLRAESSLKLLWAFEQAHSEQASDDLIASLIEQYRLPREAIPTEYLTKQRIWQALLAEMPMTAMLRNLATMTRVGLLNEWNDHTALVCSRLTNDVRLKRARIHPISVLAALRTYAQGKSERGHNTWTPLQRVVDALDQAFYLGMTSVEPTGKRFLLGLDVSGSMKGTMVAGLPYLSCVEAESAMALVTASVEPNTTIVGFDDERYSGRKGVYPLSISPRQRLDDVVKTVQKLVNGGTDCSLPIKYALTHKQPVDVFVIYTDSESWSGTQHVMQALNEYRRKMQLPAKLVVAATASTATSIGDAHDGGVLNLVGLDTSGPQLIHSFAAQ